MSFQLPGGLTAQQVIDGLGELAQAGLSVLGDAELAALVPLVTKMADDVAALVQNGPTATEVLTTEVDTEQAAAVAAGKLKFPNG